MAVIVDGKVYVDGVYVGTSNVDNCVINVDYDERIVYVIND